MNDAFEIYTEQYYEAGSLSSVYLWDVDGGFAGVVLIKKAADFAKGGAPMRGSWDSIHVFQVDEKSATKADYQLTSTIMLALETENDRAGAVHLSGSLTKRQKKIDVLVSKDNSHTANIGSQIEVVENSMRQQIGEIYFSRTKDIINDIRKRAGFATFLANKDQQAALMAGRAGANPLKSF